MGIFNAKWNDFPDCFGVPHPCIEKVRVHWVWCWFASFVFLFIYPKGGYQFVDALRTRTKFFGSGDHVFRVSERIELHIGKHLRRGG